MPDNILDASEDALAVKKRKGAFLFCLLKYSSILIAFILVLIGIFEFVRRYVQPERIYLNNASKISVVVMFLFFIVILIFALREFFKTAPKPTFLMMLALGALICALPFIAAETGNRLINGRLYFRFYTIIRDASVFAAFGLVVSFFIAFQLKTGKTTMMILLLILFLTIAGFVADYYNVFR